MGGEGLRIKLIIRLSQPQAGDWACLAWAELGKIWKYLVVRSPIRFLSFYGSDKKIFSEKLEVFEKISFFYRWPPWYRISPIGPVAEQSHHWGPADLRRPRLSMPKAPNIAFWQALCFLQNIFPDGGISPRSRAEKSSEAFQEQKLVISPFLSFLIQMVYIPPIVE